MIPGRDVKLSFVIKRYVREFLMARKKKRLFGPWSWTEDEIKLLKQLYPKGNTRKVAEQLGRPFTAVRQKAYDLGIKTKTYNYWSDKQIEQLRKLYPKMSVRDLSKRFKRSEGSVRVKAAQLGLKKK
ncbi:MAG: hypothetical protein P8016_01500 [Sedimentisphaerales bacterium]